MYEGTPPWEIGRPQPALLALAEAGAIRGRVLDVGCGTGEHVLLAASLGLEATGIDVAEAAIERARQKAVERGLEARLVVGNVLDLADLGEQFDTVLDSGLSTSWRTTTGRRSWRGWERWSGRAGGTSCCASATGSRASSGLGGSARTRSGRPSPTGGRVDSIEPVLIDTAVQRGAVHAWRAAITRN